MLREAMCLDLLRVCSTHHEAELNARNINEMTMLILPRHRDLKKGAALLHKGSR